MTPPPAAVERSAEAWDVHIGGCVECLREGNALCYEGDYLATQVVELRDSVAAARHRGARGGVARPLRSLFLPGVPA